MWTQTHIYQKKPHDKWMLPLIYNMWHTSCTSYMITGSVKVNSFPLDRQWVKHRFRRKETKVCFQSCFLTCSTTMEKLSEVLLPIGNNRESIVSQHVCTEEDLHLSGSYQRCLVLTWSFAQWMRRTRDHSLKRKLCWSIHHVRICLKNGVVLADVTR